VRPGINIVHTRDKGRDTGAVRADIVGFIAVVPKNRWPQDAVKGDFFELRLESYAELLSNPGRAFFDPVTRRSVQAFFENGGVTCFLFGVCIESEQDLTVADPLEVAFMPLIDRLREDQEISLLTMPCLAYLPFDIDKKGQPIVPWTPLVDMFLRHCKEMNHRFLILDTPRDLHEQLLIRWVTHLRKTMAPYASFGAIYYPWLKSGDEEFPPSGTIAGTYARVEREHAPFGVRWPPANEVLRGVTHPAVEVGWNEAGNFTDVGINPILWIHINTRRITSYIAEQLRRDSEWVVFENQRPELWSIMTRMVRSRLDQFWGAGLLSGSQAGSEYMVQCDREINPPEVVDAGQVNVKIVLRPVATTESIVVELRLGSNGSDIGSI
jgi:Phage tail sheath C-terminal domain